MTAKQHGKLIRKAARMIFDDKHNGACIAVYYECHEDFDAFRLFRNIFHPNEESQRINRSLYWLDDGNPESTKSHRIICLLLFAEMVEDGTIKIKP